MAQQAVMSTKESKSTKKAKQPQPEISLQDYVDFVWQSAIKAAENGVLIEFVVLNENEVGIKIGGVSLQDGRPVVK
jgi:hypothetical protein